VLRETLAGDILINLIINATKYQFDYEYKPKFKELAELLGNPNMMLSLYTDKGDAAKSEETFFLSGKDYIEEKLGDYTFKISATTFFQTNKYTTIKLYQTLKSFISEKGGDCLDVYCGSGTISIFVSDLFKKVTGIESNPASVRDAIKNAESNNVSNCEFIAERAEVTLKNFASGGAEGGGRAGTFPCVIVDPPRPGIAQKATANLITLNPKQIIYVSCNPESLKRDLEQLAQHYNIQDFQPVDMFPHTPHVESVVNLVKK
jgi:23S rRNA (uracil-5-)-methyltransferase RumA